MTPTPTGLQLIEPNFLCWDSSGDKTIGVVDVSKLAPAIDIAIRAAVREFAEEACARICSGCATKTVHNDSLCRRIRRLLAECEGHKGG